MDVRAEIAIEDVFGDLPGFETPRLVLRKFAEDDVAAVFEYGRDPDVARFVTWATHETPDDSRAFVLGATALYEAGRVAPWGVVLKDTGRLIGSAGFVTWQPDHGRAEVGYALHQSYWGQGLATEAVREIARFGFAVMQLNRLYAVSGPENAASARVMEKVGMRYEGTLRAYTFTKGEFRDLELRALLRADWLGTMRDAITIAPAVAADVPEIRRVALISWRTAYHGIYARDFIDRFVDGHYSFGGLRSAVADPAHRFLVAKDGHWVVGFCNYGPSPLGVHLYRVYVAPAYWRSGLGSRFVALMDDDLRRRGVSEYYCFVHERNDVAKAFYAKRGFVHEASRDHDSEWCMVRRLS